MTPVPADEARRAALEAGISDLAAKEAIREAVPSDGPLFLSSFFLAPKKNGEWRPILNLGKTRNPRSPPA